MYQSMFQKSVNITHLYRPTKIPNLLFLLQRTLLKHYKYATHIFFSQVNYYLKYLYN